MTTAQIDWDLACDGVPCLDFLEGLAGAGNLYVDRVSNDFAYALSSGYFVTWEGLIRLEQDLPLSGAEEAAVASLLGEESDTCVCYVDGLPRPSRPWHETLVSLAQVLLADRVDTIQAGAWSWTEAWQKLEHALDRQAPALRLPLGCTSWRDVLPTQTRWRLDLQCCLSILCGIGQHPELSLSDPETRRCRVRFLLDELVKRVDCVHALGLTLEGLLNALRMPRREKIILGQTLTRKLRLETPTARLADPIEAYRARAARRVRSGGAHGGSAASMP